MFIAVNTIEVPNPDEMAQMFRKASPKLKEFEGFIGFEVWKTENELKAVSKWDSKESFDKYVNSDTFKHQHGGSSGEEMRPKAQVSYYEAESMA